MKTPQLKNVNLKDGFLHSKYLLNINSTLNAVWDRFSDTGRIAAFDFNWSDGMPNKPHIYWDSDVAKWMEGAAYILCKNDIPEVRERLEMLIDKIEEHQEDSGYFNIYFTVCEPENRFKIRDCHELYCAGHLIEAAVAYHEMCGDERFLKLMCRYADYIYRVFVVEKSAAFTSPGHEEIELALIRLYNATKNKKYLDLCLYFLNVRGTNPNGVPDAEKYNYFRDMVCHPLNIYAQSHLPVREQNEAVGHAVRALYLYCSMADAARETDDKEMLKACMALFDDMVNRKMYITGALGQTHLGEAFTAAYDLKNESAYAETCASIAMILFAHRMFLLDHSSRYADIIEKEIYNGMLSGLSLDGKAFFYENPLEITLKNRERIPADMRKLNVLNERFAITERVEVFNCSCCPPNIIRTLGSIEQYLYSIKGKDVYIHQFASSILEEDGITLEQKTDYPNGNTIKISAQGADSILVRIPGWCERFEISAPYTMENGYARVNASDFTVELDVKPVFIMSNENVDENQNKLALTYGPIVYCAEGIDNQTNLQKLYFDTASAPRIMEKDDEFLMPTIEADGFVRKTSNELYMPLKDCFEKTTIKLIPYSCFANRGESDMLVWLNYR